MPVEDAADRAAMLEDWDTATYDGDTALAGIFDNGYAEAGVGVVGVQGTGPQFVCREADVDANPTGKALVVNGTSYTVVRGEPDGTGMTRLVLRRA